MGEVWKARDRKLGREVAVKVLPGAPFRKTPIGSARFEREARAASSLSHPNIVTIYDVGSGRSPRAGSPWSSSRAVRFARVLGRGPAAAQEDARDRRADRGRARPRARGRHRAPGPEAGKRHGGGRRPGQDPGLRSRQSSPRPPTPAAAARPRLRRAPRRASCSERSATCRRSRRAASPLDSPLRHQFALGSVLYEMTAGAETFPLRATVSEILAAVVTGPDLAALPASTPAHVEPLLRRCVERCSPRNLQVGTPRRGISPCDLAAAARPAGKGGRGSTAGTVAAGGTGRWAAALGYRRGSLARRSRPTSPSSPGRRPARSRRVATRFTAACRPGRVFDLRDRGPDPVAFSPDGVGVACSRPGGRTSSPLLYVRRPSPTWQVRRVPEGIGGRTLSILVARRALASRYSRVGWEAQEESPSRGGHRSRSATRPAREGRQPGDATARHLFPPASSGGGSAPRARHGGPAEPVEPHRPEWPDPSTHSVYPHFLPDGRRFLYVARSGRRGRDGASCSQESSAPRRRRSPRQVMLP